MDRAKGWDGGREQLPHEILVLVLVGGCSLVDKAKGWDGEREQLSHGSLVLILVSGCSLMDEHGQVEFWRTPSATGRRGCPEECMTAKAGQSPAIKKKRAIVS